MRNEVNRYFEYSSVETEYLSKADPLMGVIIDRYGMLKREMTTDLFTALVHSIVGQLISIKAADTIWRRMQERLGPITASNLARQEVEAIRGCGLSAKKAEYIQAIASSIVHGELRLDELYGLPDDEVVKRLSSLKGVGVWTAEMLMIHALERPDVVSWGDAAIRRGMMRLYGLSELTKRQFDEYRQRYSPYGTTASIYLWELSGE